MTKTNYNKIIPKIIEKEGLVELIQEKINKRFPNKIINVRDLIAYNDGNDHYINIDLNYLLGIK